MPFPGPWEQPADVIRAAGSVPDSGVGGRPVTSYQQQVEGNTVGEVQTGANGLTSATDATGQTLYALEHDQTPSTGHLPWRAQQTAITMHVSAISLAPVPPSSAELSQPGVVGYEYEGGAGAQCTRVSAPVATAHIGGAFGSVTLFDSVDQASMAADLRLVPPSYYTFDVNEVPTLSGWVTAATAAGFTQLASIPYNTAASDWDVTLPIQADDPVLLTASNYWLNGTNFDTPFGVNTILSLDFTPEWSVTQTLRPPRYRLLYSSDPPLRQRQRASGLAGTGGPPLRQIGGWHAAGDQPPLRQRQNP